MLNFKSKRTYVVLFFVFIIITVIADFVRNESVKPFPQRPDKKIEKKLDQIYLSLINGEEHVWKDMDTTLEYINSQYDCSDFDLVNLIRIIYEYGDKIPKETKSKIDSTLLNFRYWWDEPGENSMCYWSENHQILFTSAEYLAGQKYSDIVFLIVGLPGKNTWKKHGKELSTGWKCVGNMGLLNTTRTFII